MAERKSVYQNANGVRRTLHLDDDCPGVIRIQTEQVMDEVLAGIARDREIMSNSGVNKLLARIPIHIFEQAVHEKWDEGDWRRFLNSSECSPYRIWQGRV